MRTERRIWYYEIPVSWRSVLGAPSTHECHEDGVDCEAFLDGARQVPDQDSNGPHQEVPLIHHLPLNIAFGTKSLGKIVRGSQKPKECFSQLIRDRCQKKKQRSEQKRKHRSAMDQVRQ